jgi:hypothetical protein
MSLRMRNDIGALVLKYLSLGTKISIFRLQLKNLVRNDIGAFAQPDVIHWYVAP